jgi:hypothetical protein
METELLNNSRQCREYFLAAEYINCKTVNHSIRVAHKSYDVPRLKGFGGFVFWGSSFEGVEFEMRDPSPRLSQNDCVDLWFSALFQGAVPDSTTSNVDSIYVRI